MARKVRVRLDEIAEYFDSLVDPRSDVNQKHPFVSVIVIAVMAVLSGANGPTAIARWASVEFKGVRTEWHCRLRTHRS